MNLRRVIAEVKALEHALIWTPENGFDDAGENDNARD